MKHSRAKNKIQKITILYVKDHQMNMSTTSEQTRKIRDKINLKIKELGDKYFQVKAIFDQLNLHRDHLFLKGKELEALFKDQKEGLHLQTQSCRMKEALYCWYAEHFYEEILEMGPIFLAFLQKEANDEEYKRTKKAPGVNKTSKNTSVCKVERKQRIQKEKAKYKLNTSTQSNKKIRQARQILNNVDDQSMHMVHLQPVIPQIQEIQPINQINTIRQMNIQEQKQEQVVHPVQINSINSEENYNDENVHSCVDDIFQNAIDDVDMMSQNNNFYFDYSDIFYFQS